MDEWQFVKHLQINEFLVEVKVHFVPPTFQLVSATSAWNHRCSKFWPCYNPPETMVNWELTLHRQLYKARRFKYTTSARLTRRILYPRFLTVAEYNVLGCKKKKDYRANKFFIDWVLLKTAHEKVENSPINNFFQIIVPDFRANGFDPNKTIIGAGTIIVCRPASHKIIGKNLNSIVANIHHWDHWSKQKPWRHWKRIQKIIIDKIWKRKFTVNFPEFVREHVLTALEFKS